MRRCAFIDVSNISSTTINVLGFRIDWIKLIKYLKSDKWQCDFVFYYKGNNGTNKQFNYIKKLELLGYTVRTKTSYKYKDLSNNYVFKCNKCFSNIPIEIIKPGNIKSNCDVELSVDAIECANNRREFLIFTGDGDFSYLIKKLIDKGVHVRLISSTRKDKNGNKTFSSRLKEILRDEEQGLKRLSFIDINDWKFRISKQKENRPQA